MDNYEAKDNKNKTKLIICIIIIIIIILLLITSCTSSYFGKIGNILGFTEISITDTTNDKKVITNKELSFENNRYEITTDDLSYKIIYELDKLRDKGVTCSTSDADIATCIAKDGYIVVNPKRVGEVIVYAEMDTNGKIYRATSVIDIKEGKTGIKLSSYNGSIYLSKGKEKSITYNLVGIKGDVKVTVEDESIATAKAKKGILTITGKKPGKTKVTLEVEYLGRKYTATYTVNVYEKPTENEKTTTTTTKKPGTTTTKRPGTTTTTAFKKIKLNISAKNMIVGDTYTIKVTQGKAISWNSSDSSIASVDKNGKVTAKKTGKVIITAKDANGNEAKVTIVVSSKTTNPVSGIKLNPTSKTMNVGDNFTPSYSGGTPAKWETSNSSVATVSSTGKITAKKAGTATITVTDKNGKKATIKITVVSSGAETKPIKVSPTTMSMVVGDNKSITVTQGTPVKWESSNTSVATVDSNGKVTAKKAGTTTITITDKDGNKATVSVTVTNPVVAKPTLSDLIVSVSGEDDPRDISFNKNTKTYNITVDSNIDKDKITIIGVPDNSNNTITYKFDNQPETSTLENISLTPGNHTAKITITTPEGVSEEYVVNITKKASNNTNIESIKINGNQGNVDSDNNVEYVNSKVKLEINLEDPRSKITKIDGKDINDFDLNNYPLSPGKNTVKVTVKAEDGTEKNHEIIINRAERSIKLTSETDYTFDIDDAPYVISYEIYENGTLSSLTSSDVDDVEITITDFHGTITKDTSIPGRVVITPTFDDIGTHTIKASYNGSSDSKGFEITMKDFDVSSPKNKYDAIWSTDKKDTPIVINTNILSYDESGNNYSIDTSTPGTIIINNNTDDKGKVILRWDASKANLSFEKNNDGSNSYIVNITLKQKEDFTIDVIGNIYEHEVKNFQIEINVKEKYLLKLDATEDGVLNSFGNQTYEYLLKVDQEFDLSLFEPYKVDDTKNCYVFKFIEWIDEDNNTYQKADKIMISKDTTLTATYEATSVYDEISTQSYVDLIELDLFNSINEKYDIENLIYPGLEGAHTVKINNDTDSVLKIKQIEIQEETLCVSQRQCLNMGYAIRKINPDSIQNTYYYGSSTGNNINYTILNRDPLADNDIYPRLNIKGIEGYYSNRVIDIEEEKYIEIPAGSTVEIVILWKWVEIDDALDTKIGTLALEDNEYVLNVRVGFEKNTEYCTLTQTP